MTIHTVFGDQSFQILNHQVTLGAPIDVVLKTLPPYFVIRKTIEKDLEINADMVFEVTQQRTFPPGEKGILFAKDGRLIGVRNLVSPKYKTIAGFLFSLYDFLERATPAKFVKMACTRGLGLDFQTQMLDFSFYFDSGYFVSVKASMIANPEEIEVFQTKVLPQFHYLKLSPTVSSLDYDQKIAAANKRAEELVKLYAIDDHKFMGESVNSPFQNSYDPRLLISDKEGNRIYLNACKEDMFDQGLVFINPKNTVMRVSGVKKFLSRESGEKQLNERVNDLRKNNFPFLAKTEGCENRFSTRLEKPEYWVKSYIEKYKERVFDSSPPDYAFLDSDYSNENLWSSPDRMGGKCYLELSLFFYEGTKEWILLQTFSDYDEHMIEFFKFRWIEMLSSKLQFQDKDK